MSTTSSKSSRTYLKTLTNETAQLLALARYDGEAYRQWLAS